METIKEKKRKSFGHLLKRNALMIQLAKECEKYPIIKKLTIVKEI